jgi:hypothetical protein
MKITDAQMFESLEFLRDDDNEISRARARRIVIEEGRKHLKARLINQSESKSFVQKEQDAYGNADYRKLLESLQIAIADDEHYRLLVDHHKARIEVWRSQSANERFINQRI